jgi:hypothetical protein
MDAAGAALDTNRRPIMIDRQLGLTALYNRVHQPDEHDAEIERLRELPMEIDEAVAEAYGWADMALDHGFHETAQGVRFTIGHDARREVLRRLLALNHELHAEEEARGLVKHKRGRGAQSPPLFQEA